MGWSDISFSTDVYELFFWQGRRVGVMGTRNHQLSVSTAVVSVVKLCVTHLGWNMGKSCGFGQGHLWDCWEWKH